ncbi:MAG: hypothetical protein CSA34_00180 [Desulfobulbus propionicus]|nr:MAG: hypothetical protein CSA34_00180 [Desulfobulbus propionicus]
MARGLASEGVEVTWEKLEPRTPLKFPVGSVPATVLMMLKTFFRQRIPLYAPSAQCYRHWDLIILGGPTWSYNPSGPILALMDNYGPAIFANRKVIVLITCRGYWRLHLRYLTKRLQRFGTTVVNRIVFTHLNPEPWRTLGVFWKLAGGQPEKTPVFSRYYRQYGHTLAQLAQARMVGKRLGKALVEGSSLVGLCLDPEDYTPPMER